MIGKKLLALFGVLVLGAGLVASPTLGAKKKCKKLCRDNIAACRLATCKPLTKGKKKCNRTCKSTIIQQCKSNPTSTTCSPSGAFLDDAAL